MYLNELKIYVSEVLFSPTEIRKCLIICIKYIDGTSNLSLPYGKSWEDSSCLNFFNFSWYVKQTLFAYRQIRSDYKCQLVYKSLLIWEYY